MSTEYAAGFAAGENRSFKDRKHKVTRVRPDEIKGEYQRGFWEGYTPRSQVWRHGVDPKNRLQEAA